MVINFPRLSNRVIEKKKKGKKKEKEVINTRTIHTDLGPTSLRILVHTIRLN